MRNKENIQEKVQSLTLLKNSKHPLRDIISYFEGNLRYRVYYNRWKFLIRKHIKEQIDYRIRIMKPECYRLGSCTVCGCQTTQLQMATKACDGLCYPPLMDKDSWSTKQAIHGHGLVWIWFYKDNKYILFKETPTTYVPYHKEDEAKYNGHIEYIDNRPDIREV